jgi:hypothetical protein
MEDGYTCYEMRCGELVRWLGAEGADFRVVDIDESDDRGRVLWRWGSM